MFKPLRKKKTFFDKWRRLWPSSGQTYDLSMETVCYCPLTAHRRPSFDTLPGINKQKIFIVRKYSILFQS